MNVREHGYRRFPMVKYDPPEVFYWGDEIDKETARSLNLPRYFTGIPCKWGHVSERWVNGGTCVACHHARRDTDEWREHMRERLETEEEYRQRVRDERKRCRPRIREQRRERYASDSAYREAIRQQNAKRYQRRKAQGEQASPATGECAPIVPPKENRA